MNSSIFYMTATVFALGGLWLLWELGVRPLMLDNFRDSLFALRDNLYQLSQQGRIVCDSEAYRTVELLLNGVIRYAHRFTFSSYMMGQIEMDEARKRGEDVDFARQVYRVIQSVEDAEVREELRQIVRQVSTLIPRYTAKSSLVFMIIAIAYLVTRQFQPMLAHAKKSEAVSAFEREAYLASQSDAYARA